MQRLRIVVGHSVGDEPETPGLETVVRTDTLVVQADPEVGRFPSPQCGTVFASGRVLGARGIDGSVDTRGTWWASLTAPVSAPAVDRLEGHFLLLVPGQDNCWELWQDRFGQIDVYYVRHGERMVLATDLDLLPFYATEGGLDQLSLAHALCVYGTRPPKQHTYYRSVRRLAVGEYVRIQNGEARIVETPFSPARTWEYEDQRMDEYVEAMLESVRARASDVGNVVYLSSGWDSTGLLACLVHLFGPHKVRCVIGRMRYSERAGVINQFELDRARAIAEFYGVRLDTVEFDYRTRGPEYFDRLRGLFARHQLSSFTGLSHELLAEAAAADAQAGEVVFLGEISDGAHNLGFSQYVTIFHPSQAFREYSDKMASYLFGPSFLRLLLAGDHEDDAVFQLLMQRAGGAPPDDLAADAEARTRQLLASFFLRPGRLPLSSLENAKILTSKGRQEYEREMAGVYLDTPSTATPETLYAWYLRLYNSFHWQGSTVATARITAASRGLTLEMPFWDSRVQDFLSAMPESWGRGLDLNPVKYPLKWMFKHRIRYPYHLQVGPHSYLYDVDPTFSHGVELMYASAFTPDLKERLKRKQLLGLLAPDLFDLDYLDGVVQRYIDGSEARGQELNDLIAVALLSTVGLREASE